MFLTKERLAMMNVLSISLLISVVLALVVLSEFA
jgi:hypothetical protein